MRCGGSVVGCSGSVPALLCVARAADRVAFVGGTVVMTTTYVNTSGEMYSGTHW